MTRSVDVWKCFVIFGYILQPVHAGTTYTSKACYGSGGLDCTRHDISCNSTQKIAICDAYYTNNTKCTQSGLSNCDSFSVDGVAEYGYHRFNNTELVSLFIPCSTKSQCVFKGPHEGATRTFSVVKYQCIEGKHKTVTECTQTGLSSCGNFNADGVAEYGYHRFNNTELVSLYNTCSTKSRCVYVAPQRSAVRTFSVVTYRCIEASDPFDVRCQPVASTGEITTRPNNDGLPIPTSSRFPAGVFMGGVAVGAVVVTLVGLAVYVLVIRRRYDLTAKKQGDTPASVQHPTYSGLSAGGDVNNYTSIEQTSRSQEDSTHGSTATTDYQHI